MDLFQNTAYTCGLSALVGKEQHQGMWIEKRHLLPSILREDHIALGNS